MSAADLNAKPGKAAIARGGDSRSPARRAFDRFRVLDAPVAARRKRVAPLTAVVSDEEQPRRNHERERTGM